MPTLDVNATVPANTTATATVHQDDNGDGTPDASEAVTLQNGLTSETLNTITSVSGSEYWIEFDLSTSDKTVTPSVQDATLSLTSAPSAPSGLTATAASDTQIDLSWTDNSSGGGEEDNFRIERSPDGSTWSFLTDKGQGVTSHSDTGLTEGTTYHYRVRAENGMGNSGWSNTDSATTHAHVSSTVSPTTASGAPKASTPTTSAEATPTVDWAYHLEYAEARLPVPQTVEDAVNNGKYTVLFKLQVFGENGGTNWPDYIGSDADSWRIEDTRDGIGSVSLYVDDQTVAQGSTQKQTGYVFHATDEADSVAFVVDATAIGGSVHSYKNGEFKRTVDHPGKDNQVTVSFTELRLNGYGGTLDFIIDRIDFYNRVLSTEEVAAWKKQQEAPTSGLVCSYAFDEGPGGTPTCGVSGLTSNMNNGTYVASPFSEGYLRTHAHSTPKTAFNGRTADASITSAVGTPLSPTVAGDAVGTVVPTSATVSTLEATSSTSSDATVTPTTMTATPLSAVFGNANWLINMADTGQVVSETRTWDALTLTFRVSDTVADEVLRPLNAKAGEVEVVMDNEGALRAYDRAGGANTWTLTAPYNRGATRFNPGGPWEREATYHVAKYEEEAVDQQGQRYDISVTLTPAASREPSGSGSDGAPDNGEWEFAFSDGRISTKRVRHEVTEEVKDGVTETTLNLILEPEQVRTLTESASYQGAVNVREVPDGDNKVEDNSSEKRNSVHVTPPHDYALEVSGEDGGLPLPDDHTLSRSGGAVAFRFKTDVDFTGHYANRCNILGVQGNGGKFHDNVVLNDSGDDYYQLQGETNDNGEFYLSGSRDIEKGVEHSVVISGEGGVFTTYVDGEEYDSRSVGADVLLGRIGGRYSDSYYEGLLDDLVFWDRSLSATEASDYHEGSIPPSGRIHEWTFNEGPDSTLFVDSVGQDHLAHIPLSAYTDSPFHPNQRGRRYLSPGNYRVADWEVEWQNNSYYLVSLTLKPAGDTAETTQAVGRGLDATATTT